MFMSDFSSEEWRRLHTNNNENNKNEQPTKVDPDQHTHTVAVISMAHSIEMIWMLCVSVVFFFQMWI